MYSFLKNECNKCFPLFLFYHFTIGVDRKPASFTSFHGSSSSFWVPIHPMYSLIKSACWHSVANKFVRISPSSSSSSSFSSFTNKSVVSTGTETTEYCIFTVSLNLNNGKSHGNVAVWDYKKSTLVWFEPDGRTAKHHDWKLLQRFFSELLMTPVHLIPIQYAQGPRQKEVRCIITFFFFFMYDGKNKHQRKKQNKTKNTSERNAIEFVCR